MGKSILHSTPLRLLPPPDTEYISIYIYMYINTLSYPVVLTIILFISVRHKVLIHTLAHLESEV